MFHTLVLVILISGTSSGISYSNLVNSYLSAILNERKTVREVNDFLKSFEPLLQSMTLSKNYNKIFDEQAKYYLCLRFGIFSIVTEDMINVTRRIVRSLMNEFKRDIIEGSILSNLQVLRDCFSLLKGKAFKQLVHESGYPTNTMLTGLLKYFKNVYIPVQCRYSLTDNFVNNVGIFLMYDYNNKTVEKYAHVVSTHTLSSFYTWSKNHTIFISDIH